MQPRVYLYHSPTPKMNALLKTCLAFALLLAIASPATALSWPLCSSNTGGSVWVTERPRTGPQFPGMLFLQLSPPHPMALQPSFHSHPALRIPPFTAGANLFYFCDEGLNILGASIDPCVNNGATCTPAIADAICTLLGYERAYTADFNVSRAEPDEVVMSLTGEYCVREGVYAAKAPSPEELAAAQGTPCNKISSISCIRLVATASVSSFLCACTCHKARC
jgi:hypothetical protein